jgi:hypothetical protein
VTETPEREKREWSCSENRAVCYCADHLDDKLPVKFIVQQHVRFIICSFLQEEDLQFFKKYAIL